MCEYATKMYNEARGVCESVVLQSKGKWRRPMRGCGCQGGLLFVVMRRVGWSGVAMRWALVIAKLMGARRLVMIER